MSHAFCLRYAAPEQYIMSTQTPSAPSAPVAAALSPVLWQVFYLPSKNVSFMTQDSKGLMRFSCVF